MGCSEGYAALRCKDVSLKQVAVLQDNYSAYNAATRVQSCACYGIVDDLEGRFARLEPDEVF